MHAPSGATADLPGTALEPVPVAWQQDRQVAPATFYVVAGGNDLSWRVDTPAKALGAKVIKIPQETGGRQIREPNLEEDGLRWYLNVDGLSVFPDHEGQTAVWTRPDQMRATHALSQSEQGIRVVAEVDDNYLSNPKHNLYMRAAYERGEAEGILRAFAPFDAIITTTDWLANRYRVALKRLGVDPLPDFHVCGNHVDPDSWPEREDYDGPTRVGWMGSDSHWRDVWTGYGALWNAAEHGCRVILIGYNPDWFPQCKLRGKIKRRAIGFEYEHIAWVDPREWSRPAYPLDIAIAPLEDNEFTHGRSDVKFLEYSMSGAATVASHTIYEDTIRHGETGLIARSTEEMARHVVRLIHDPKMRRELADNAAQYVREERLITLKQNLDPWKAAICP